MTALERVRRVEKPELLDNPNDPRGRTNVQIAADALMADCDSTEMVRYDDEGTCEWLLDGKRVRGPHHCVCLMYAKQVVAALEATGRLPATPVVAPCHRLNEAELPSRSQL